MFRVRRYASVRGAHSRSERHARRRPLPASGARFILYSTVTSVARAKEVAMDQVLEQRPAPEAVPEIDATLNYFVNDGSKIFTEASGGGAPDKRGGTIDARQVGIHNGRAPARGVAVGTGGFPFVAH